MRRRLGPRFGVEAGLIAASAALAALLELDWPGIVAIVFGTWLAIALFEVAWSRTRPASPDAEAPAPELVQPAVVVTPTSVAPQPPPPPAPPAPAVGPPPPPPPPTARVERPRPDPAAGAPRSWNLWELERRARDLAGDDPAADEERQYMLLYLRDFASADGKLPIDFDPLVREAFGDRPAVAS